MGAVFRAHDGQLEREVALKLLPLDQTTDPEIVQRFYQEGRAAAQLDHENIARVYSIGQDGPHHFIAFEFIEGVTVRRRVDENGPLSVHEAVDITLQIAQALVHAANRGVVHRDIKPSNIILTPHGRAKLVDMGLARRFEREADHGLTQSGMTLGTFDYISPEQARDPRDVDVRSDLYSLGCTLFHMLTGRPPFPGGTVLQKLLQHQEEPPPDVRTLNQLVPAELARIISKLLAKDRDRRYQSPEQLVRDLLTLAGQVGLALSQANQHSWIVAGHPLTWQHHQAWFFPVLAFVLVVAGLVWWGREQTNPAPLEPGYGSTRSTRSESGPSTRTTTLTGETTESTTVRESERGSSTQVASLPPNVPVRPGEDLLSAIARAPRKATITLTEDGTYLLGGRTSGFRGSWPLLNRDVTIRAESNTRPVLRFAADARLADRPLPALLPFSGGNVTIEGLVFELDPDSVEDRLAAILAEDTELTLRGCCFRQSAVHPGENRAALRIRNLRAPAVAGDRPPPLFAYSCHFDGGQVGIHVEGAADIVLRDCTMGPGSPMIWLDNKQSIGQVPVDLWLNHTSLMAASGTIFLIEGALARISVDDCVLASAGPSRSALPTLVAADNPRNIQWLGRSNLYGKIGAYLEATRKSDGLERITGFSQWENNGSEVREKGSMSSSESVWKETQPIQKLIIDQEDPTRAFEVADHYLAKSSFGAREGPGGTLILSTVPIAQRQSDAPGDVKARLRPETSPGATIRSQSEDAPLTVAQARSDSQGPTAKVTASGREVETSSAPFEDDELSGIPSMPPMATSSVVEGESTPPADNSRPDASQPRLSPRERPESRGRAGADANAGAGEKSRGYSDHNLIRSAEQFLDTVTRLGPKGGTLKLARGLDLELPATELIGSAHWQIEAEPAGDLRRPRVRFRPSAFPTRSSAAWSTLFTTRSGSLGLQGLDILIQEPHRDLPGTSRIAAFGMSAGSKLELSDCTITVDSAASDSAAVVVLSGTSDPKTVGRGPETETSPAKVKVRNGFIRSAGDLIKVSPGRYLDLQLENVLVGTDGSLLHAMGSSNIPRAVTALKLKIEHTLARTKAGLVYLESTLEDPELPLTDIGAQYSIFNTAGQAPLFRVDGYGQMEGLRDRIVWRGERIAYDQITTYRRDQIIQIGAAPRNYTRSDWRNAFDPKDDSPVLDDVRFLTKLDPSRPAVSLTKDDLTLHPQSPVLESGPDLKPIPSPPPFDS
jgi:serine/threonine-protein kinase